MAIPEEIDMEVLKEQMSGLRLLCELPDPVPLLKNMRNMVPGYTGRPEELWEAEKARQLDG